MNTQERPHRRFRKSRKLQPSSSGILIGESQLETLLMSHSKISFTTARDVAVPVQGCTFAGQWVKEEGASYVSIMREGDV
jgi:hypothetical protein